MTRAAAVVELFSEWCGPCKSILPTFRRIRLDRDDESALLFLTVRTCQTTHHLCKCACTQHHDKRQAGRGGADR